jgi:hypothetical protein
MSVDNKETEKKVSIYALKNFHFIKFFFFKETIRFNFE